MKYIVAALVLSVLSTGTCQADAPTPEKIAASFFDSLIKGESEKAVDEFFSSNPLIKEKTQQVQLLKSQLGTVNTIYGAPFAVELVSVEDITPSLERRVYITKHKWHPITWELYFYKPQSVWIADQMLFQDQYQTIGRKK